MASRFEDRNAPQTIECPGLALGYREFTGGEVAAEAVGEVRVFVPLGEGQAIVGQIESADGTRHESLVRAPRAWVVPAGIAAGYFCDAPARVLTIALDPEACGQEVVDPVVVYDRYLRRVASVLGAAFRVGPAPDTAYLAATAAELALHVGAYYGRPLKQARCQGLSPERVARALKLIEENLSKPIHVDEIAAEVNMSPFHFARMFKQSTGYSPHFYITLKRMDLAKEMLANSSLPLAEVAERLGYSTQAHFTGVFSAYSGTTPRAYRTRFRKPGRGAKSANVL
jgi:AraC-like DNA-binding protein